MVKGQGEWKSRIGTCHTLEDCLEVLAGEASYTYTLDVRPICVYGEGGPLSLSAHFGKDAGGVVREEADTHLASHTN